MDVHGIFQHLSTLFRNQGDGGTFAPRCAQSCTAPLYIASPDLHSPAAAQRRPKCVAGLRRAAGKTKKPPKKRNIAAKTSATCQNHPSPGLPSASGVSKSLGEPCSTNFPASRTTTSEGHSRRLQNPLDKSGIIWNPYWILQIHLENLESSHKRDGVSG